MTPDPDHVHLVALLFHNKECLPRFLSYEQYTVRHRQVHENHAERFLAGLRDAGYALTTTEEER